MPPRLAKLLALVVAVAMVGGAFYFRSRSDDEGTKIDDGTKRSGKLRIACVSELTTACQALAGDDVEIVLTDAGDTADTLAAADAGPPPYDAWITLEPWPAMVDVVRQVDQRPALFDKTPAVASQPLAILTFASVVEELKPPCGGAVDWSCLGDNAGAQRKVAIPAAKAALGVLVAGQAASSRLETTDFDRDAIRAAPFQAWLKRLLGNASSRTSDAAIRMAQLGPAAFIAAGTTKGFGRAAATSPQGQQKQMIVVDPRPAATAKVVVAPLVSGDRADRAIALLTGKTGSSALRQAGWTVPAVAGGTGLPDAGVLVALREEIE